jgi:hypothetical protein
MISFKNEISESATGVDADADGGGLSFVLCSLCFVLRRHLQVSGKCKAPSTKFKVRSLNQLPATAFIRRPGSIKHQLSLMAVFKRCRVSDRSLTGSHRVDDCTGEGSKTA